MMFNIVNDRVVVVMLLLCGLFLVFFGFFRWACGLSVTGAIKGAWRRGLVAGLRVELVARVCFHLGV